MRTQRLPQTAALLALAAIVVAACGGSTASSTTTTAAAATTTVTTMADAHDEFSFGEPADASEADRVIEVTAADDFTFDPATVTVKAGDTITFRIVNNGAIPHDFTLGDQETQDEHEAEMAEMAGMEMHDEANAVALAPGETKELTWHFTEPGAVLIGCHQPGHYSAGMTGAITVES